MGNCWDSKASSSSTTSLNNLSRVGTSQTTSSSLSSNMVAGSYNSLSASSSDAPEPPQQGHILPLPNLRIFLKLRGEGQFNCFHGTPGSRS